MTIIPLSLKVKNEKSFDKKTRIHIMNPNERDISVEAALYNTLFEEHYLGCYDSLSVCVKELMTVSSDIPEWMTKYIDWDKIGQDWKSNGDLVAIETSNEMFHLFLRKE